MRLTCPNCRAQYEVADSAIPARGRDVQCSSCGHGWFQLPDAGAAPVPPAPTPEPPRVAGRETPQRDLDPAIADVLRAEAAREALQRRRETAPLMEAQQEMALDEAPAPPPETPAPPTARVTPKPARFADAKRSEVPRRDLLPDIEEINSSLRAKTLSRAAAANRLTEAEHHAQQRSGRGFRLGFASVLLVALCAVLVYANAGTIATRMPATQPVLEAYVARMNDGRLWINAQLRAGGAMVEGLFPGSED